MYCSTAQLCVKPDVPIGEFKDSIQHTLSQFSHNQVFNLSKNLEGSFGTGTYTCHFISLHTEEEIYQALIKLDTAIKIDLVTHQTLAVGLRSPKLKRGIGRTLLLKVKDNATEAQKDGLESDTLAMPDHLHGICNWSLSRTVNNHKWSHVWQQEYEEIDDLNGEYMMHPYHWAWVDRWFDCENPDHCVEGDLCHAFYPIETSLLAAIDSAL